MLVCDLLFLAHHPALVAWLSPPWLFQMLSVLPWVLHQAPSVSSPAAPTATSTGWSVYQQIKLKGHCAPSILLSTSIAAHRAREKPLESRWMQAIDFSATQNPDSMVRGSSGRWNALVNAGCVWLPRVYSSSFQTLPSHTAMLQPSKRSWKQHTGPLMWRQ